MAATDPQTLFSEAACYACYASNPYTLNLLKLALLQQIANNIASPTTGVFNGAASPEGVITATKPAIYYGDDGSLWVKDSGTGNTGWVQLIA